MSVARDPVVSVFVSCLAMLAASVLPSAGQTEPAVAPQAIAALLQSAPGAYTVRGRAIDAAPADAATPVFVQADAYRRTPEGVLVPVVVGAEVAEAWSLQLNVVPAGGATAGPTTPALATTMTGESGTIRRIHEFTLAPGEYEVVLALVRGAGGRRPVATVARQALTIPDPAAAALGLGPVVLGDAAFPATPEQSGRAFSFGPTSVAPAALNRFRQAQSLYLAFRAFGWKRDDQARPDVTVEYVFRQVLAGQPRFFNKVKPQELNATTLGKSFDGKSGELPAGMAVPLAAFPPGEFQVAVRVHDKRTQTTAEQTVRFVVTAS